MTIMTTVHREIPNYHRVEVGDYLYRNSYSTYHFKAGTQYKVTGFKDGLPVVKTDYGYEVLTPNHNPVYFDLIKKKKIAKQKLYAGMRLRYKDASNDEFTRNKMYQIEYLSDGKPVVINDFGAIENLTSKWAFSFELQKEADLEELKEGDLVHFTRNLGSITEGMSYLVRVQHGGPPYIQNDKGRLIPLKYGMGVQKSAHEPLGGVPVASVNELEKVRDELIQNMMKLGVTQETATKAFNEITESTIKMLQTMVVK